MPPTRGTRPGRPVDPSESRALHTILYSLNRTRFTGKVWIKVEWQWGRINTARDKVNPANWEIVALPAGLTSNICLRPAAWDGWQSGAKIYSDGGISKWEVGKGDANGAVFDASASPPREEYQYSVELQICPLDQCNNTIPIPVGRCRVLSFNDKDFTTHIGTSSWQTVEIPPTDIYYIPIKACGTSRVLTHRHHQPALEPGTNKTLFIKVDRNSSNYNARSIPADGDTIEICLNGAKNYGGTFAGHGALGCTAEDEVRECYRAGMAVDQDEIDGYTFGPDKQYMHVEDLETYTWKPNPSALEIKPVKSINDTSKTGKEWIEQGDYIKLTGAVDCDECVGDGSGSWFIDVHDRNAKALASIGFGEGISNTVFGGDIMYETTERHSDGSTNPRNLKYGTAWTVGHARTPLGSLPGGATVRNKIEKTITQSTPVGEDIFWGCDVDGNPIAGTTRIHAMLESVVQKAWEASMISRLMLRRDFGDDSRDLAGDFSGGAGPIDDTHSTFTPRTGNLDSGGLYQKENISQHNAANVAIAFKEIINHTTTAQVGVDVGKAISFTASMVYNKSSASTVDDALRSGSWSAETISVSASIDMMGLCSWMASSKTESIRTQGALDANGRLKQEGWGKFADSLKINLDLGSMGRTTKNLREFDVNLNSDLNVEIDEGSFTTVAQDTGWTGPGIFKLQQASFTYSIAAWNGWNFTMSGMKLGEVEDTDKDGNVTRGWGWQGPTSYVLSGDNKDPIKWSIGYHGGKPRLAASTRFAIFRRQKELTEDEAIAAGEITGKRVKYLNPPGSVISSGSRDFNAFYNMKVVAVPDSRPGKTWKFETDQNFSGNAGGFNWAVSAKDGTTYIRKQWEPRFPGSWIKFLNLDPTLGDKIKLTGSLEARWQPINGPSFSISADLTFQKTIVQLGDVLGRLIINADAYAKFVLNSGLGPIQQADYIGFGATMGVRWNNNILEWMGLPFNIHPGIHAGFAANFTFGGYTKDIVESSGLGDEDERTAPGISIRPAMIYSFALGNFSWDLVLVDSFRAHMKRRHNSVFDIFGLGSCPVLNVFGPQENLWQYISRVAPFRAMAAIGQAAKTCQSYRWDHWTSLYRQERTDAFAVETGIVGGGANGQKYLGICATNPVNAAGQQVGKKFHKGTTRPVPCGRLPDCPKIGDGKNGTMSAAELVMMVGETKSDGTATPGDMAQNANYWLTPAGEARHQANGRIYPCMPRQEHIIAHVNELILAWDQANKRCQCIQDEFEKLSSDKYWGRRTRPGSATTGGALFGYDWTEWADDLGGDDPGLDEDSRHKQGVITKGLARVDQVIMDFYIKGFDPKDDKIPLVNRHLEEGAVVNGVKNIRNAQGRDLSACASFDRISNLVANKGVGGLDGDAEGEACPEGGGATCSWPDARCFVLIVHEVLKDIIDDVYIDKTGTLRGDYNDARITIRKGGNWAGKNDDSKGTWWEDGCDTGRGVWQMPWNWGGRGTRKAWWQDGSGICAGLKRFLTYTVGLVWKTAGSILTFPFRLIAGLLGGGGSAVAAVDKLKKRSMKASKPCGFGSAIVETNCYDTFLDWEDYQKSYVRWIHFIASNSGDQDWVTAGRIDDPFKHTSAYNFVQAAESMLPDNQLRDYFSTNGSSYNRLIGQPLMAVESDPSLTSKWTGLSKVRIHYPLRWSPTAHRSLALGLRTYADDSTSWNKQQWDLQKGRVVGTPAKDRGEYWPRDESSAMKDNLMSVVDGHAVHNISEGSPLSNSAGVIASADSIKTQAISWKVYLTLLGRDLSFVDNSTAFADDIIRYDMTEYDEAGLSFEQTQVAPTRGPGAGMNLNSQSLCKNAEEFIAGGQTPGNLASNYGIRLAYFAQEGSVCDRAALTNEAAAIEYGINDVSLDPIESPGSYSHQYFSAFIDHGANSRYGAGDLNSSNSGYETTGGEIWDIPNEAKPVRKLYDLTGPAFWLNHNGQGAGMVPHWGFNPMASPQPLCQYDQDQGIRAFGGYIVSLRRLNQNVGRANPNNRYSNPYWLYDHDDQTIRFCSRARLNNQKVNYNFEYNVVLADHVGKNNATGLTNIRNIATLGNYLQEILTSPAHKELTQHYSKLYHSSHVSNVEKVVGAPQLYTWDEVYDLYHDVVRRLPFSFMKPNEIYTSPANPISASFNAYDSRRIDSPGRGSFNHPAWYGRNDENWAALFKAYHEFYRFVVEFNVNDSSNTIGGTAYGVADKEFVTSAHNIMKRLLVIFKDTIRGMLLEHFSKLPAMKFENIPTTSDQAYADRPSLDFFAYANCFDFSDSSSCSSEPINVHDFINYIYYNILLQGDNAWTGKYLPSLEWIWTGEDGGTSGMIVTDNCTPSANNSDIKDCIGATEGTTGSETTFAKRILMQIQRNLRCDEGGRAVWAARASSSKVYPGKDLGIIYETWRMCEHLGKFMPTSPFYDPRAGRQNVTDLHSAQITPAGPHYPNYADKTHAEAGFCWHNILLTTAFGPGGEIIDGVYRQNLNKRGPVGAIKGLSLSNVCGCESPTNAPVIAPDDAAGGMTSLCGYDPGDGSRGSGTKDILVAIWNELKSRPRTGLDASGAAVYEVSTNWNFLKYGVVGNLAAPAASPISSTSTIPGQLGGLSSRTDPIINSNAMCYEYPITRGIWTFPGVTSSWVDDAVMHGHIQQPRAVYNLYYNGKTQAGVFGGRSSGAGPAASLISSTSPFEFEGQTAAMTSQQMNEILFAQREPQRELEVGGGAGPGISPPASATTKYLEAMARAQQEEENMARANSKGTIGRNLDRLNQTGTYAGQIRPARRGPDSQDGSEEHNDPKNPYTDDNEQNSSFGQPDAGD